MNEVIEIDCTRVQLFIAENCCNALLFNWHSFVSPTPYDVHFFSRTITCPRTRTSFH